MGQPLSQSSVDPVLNEKIYQIATIYEELLSKYAHKEIRFLKSSPCQGPSSGIWRRAITLADELGVTYRFFVQANFYWMHKWFHAAPKPMQLATPKAADRAHKYRNLVDRGLVDPNDVIHGVVFPSDNKLREPWYKNPLTSKTENHNLKILELLMAAHPGLDEEHIYQIPEFLNRFDTAWLNERPAYQKLKEQKKL